MGLNVYIIIEETGYEVYQTHVIGAVIDEDTAKEVVDILNNRNDDSFDPEYGPVYSYFEQKVYGRADEFMNEEGDNI